MDKICWRDSSFIVNNGGKLNVLAASCSVCCLGDVLCTLDSTWIVGWSDKSPDISSAGRAAGDVTAFINKRCTRSDWRTTFPGGCAWHLWVRWLTWKTIYTHVTEPFNELERLRKISITKFSFHSVHQKKKNLKLILCMEKRVNVMNSLFIYYIVQNHFNPCTLFLNDYHQQFITVKDFQI